MNDTIDPPPFRRILTKNITELSLSEQSILIEAMYEASFSEETNRHGCILFVKKKIISRGRNKSKTHPAAIRYFSKCLHAELSAIVSANKQDLRGSSIFVVRLYRKLHSKANEFDYTRLSMSRPCKHCMDLIREAGIKKAYYTIGNRKIAIEKI
jgi:tRNA(Arg) A34 adenosine deaminase TadA